MAISSVAGARKVDASSIEIIKHSTIHDLVKAAQREYKDYAVVINLTEICITVYQVSIASAPRIIFLVLFEMHHAGESIEDKYYLKTAVDIWILIFSHHLKFVAQMVFGMQE